MGLMASVATLIEPLLQLSQLSGDIMTPNYHIFTDGGCRGNGKVENPVGSWAMIVYNQSGKRIGSKASATIGTTNNEMELTAIFEAIKWANSKQYSIEISSDSAYCINGCSSWVWGWAKKGWKKADGGQVLNQGLWQNVMLQMELYKGIHGEIPTFHKVKGHSGDPRNNEVDALVNVKMTELEMSE